MQKDQSPPIDHSNQQGVPGTTATSDDFLAATPRWQGEQWRESSNLKETSLDHTPNGLITSEIVLLR